MNPNFEEPNASNIVKIGVSSFDGLCDGGVLKGSVITLSGFPGTGRSTFAMQFLVEGASNFNENGIYIIFEDSADSALLQFSQYKWGVNELIASQKISVLDYPIAEIDQILSPQGVVKDFIEKVGAKRIVIDSVFPIGLHYDNNKRNAALIKFVNLVKSWGLTVMVIASEVSGPGFPRTTYGVERFSDGWIRLNSVYHKNERIRTLEIMKMKGRPHTMKIHQFIINDTGIHMLDKDLKLDETEHPEPMARNNQNKKSDRPKKKDKAVKKPFKKVRQKYKV